MATYRFHGPDGAKRVYHHHDVHHTGPSVSLRAFYQGVDPPAPQRPTGRDVCASGDHQPGRGAPGRKRQLTRNDCSKTARLS